ncbi:hypothetical protein C8J56DRAFT_1039460 [Mycena floridula]|nr:hypothetical protein C8J56DRAFT_1039460 [Mycena floridula]
MSTDCTADIQHYLRLTGELIMNAGLPLMVSIMFFTIYLMSVVFTVCVLRQKGLNRARTALLVFILIMFVVDTLVFSLYFYSFFQQTREVLLNGKFQGDGLRPSAAVVAIQTVLAPFLWISGDFIVVWRAYAVWTRSRIVMAIPVLFLLGCVVNYPFFLACNIKHRDAVAIGLGTTACFMPDAASSILSFCANISATLVISYTAWSYYRSRRTLRDAGVLQPCFSPVARILLLLVEAGFAYLLVMIFTIIAMLYPVPTASYGPTTIFIQILNDVTLHCCAMVPTMTILLVNLYGSFGEHESTTVAHAPIQFATPRVTEPSYPSVLHIGHVSAISSDPEAGYPHNSGSGRETKPPRL